MSEWRQKLKGKKGAVVILINNMGPSKVILKSSKLFHGKYYKKSKEVESVASSSIEEMALVDKVEGEWCWGLEDDPLHVFKMYISCKDSTVKYEDLPATSPWNVEVQQEWDSAIPQVIVTIFTRDGSNGTVTPFNSTSSLPSLSEQNDR